MSYIIKEDEICEPSQRLGPQISKKPLVKILKVEDLKNDYIVARIKKELVSNMNFGRTESMSSHKSSEQKSEPFYIPPQAHTTTSKNTLNVISEKIFHPYQIKQEASECATSPSEECQPSESELELIEEIEIVETDEVMEPDSHQINDAIIDCEASTTQHDTSPPSDVTPQKETVPSSKVDFKEPAVTPKDICEMTTDNRIILVREERRGVFSKERREKFLQMKVEPPKRKKIPKCLRPLEELPKPKDQIRCPSCKVLFNRSIFAKHEFLCQGSNKKKKKFGCLNCSYTDYNMKELEAHILREHINKR